MTRCCSAKALALAASAACCSANALALAAAKTSGDG
jgi:hypothetical protein